MATNPNPELWKKVRVDVQSALATAKTLVSISKASPAVAGSTAHGYVDGDILLLLVEGMTDLNFRVVRVDNSDTDDFELEGIDSTGFDDFISGTAQKITFGTTASTFQDVSPSGGEAAQVEIATIHSDQNYQLPGNLSAVSYQFNSLWKPEDPALAALLAFYGAGTFCCVAFRFQSGRKVYLAGYPSTSQAPGGTAGNAVTTSVAINVRGKLQYYAS